MRIARRGQTNRARPAGRKCMHERKGAGDRAKDTEDDVHLLRVRHAASRERAKTA